MPFTAPTFTLLRAIARGCRGKAMIRFALSQEQVHIVERLVASGRYAAPDNVIGAALALLEVRERERLDCLAALHEALSVTGDGAPAEASDAGVPLVDALRVDAPALERPEPFDGDALAEIERLIASRATGALV